MPPSEGGDTKTVTLARERARMAADSSTGRQDQPLSPPGAKGKSHKRNHKGM